MSDWIEGGTSLGGGGVLLWGVLGCDAWSMLSANASMGHLNVFGVTATLRSQLPRLHRLCKAVAVCWAQGRRYGVAVLKLRICILEMG